eukprot:1370935-Rhodomonas_salina.1
MATYWKNTESQRATASIRRRLLHTQGSQARDQRKMYSELSEHYTHVEVPGTASSPTREFNTA